MRRVVVPNFWIPPPHGQTDKIRGKAMPFNPRAPQKFTHVFDMVCLQAVFYGKEAQAPMEWGPDNGEAI